MTKANTKKIIRYVMGIILKVMPMRILDLFFTPLYSFNPDWVYKASTNLSYCKLVKSRKSFFGKFRLLSDSELVSYRDCLIDPEAYEDVRSPDIYGFSKNNFTTLRKHEISIYCFPNAEIRAKSDVIKVGGYAFWEKARRPEFAQTIPVDSDFIAIDSMRDNIIAFEQKKARNFSMGFSLCGVHTNTWAHFIISYLPKIIALKRITVGSTIALFVPNNMLQNNKDLIELLLNERFDSNEVELIYVSDEEVIKCAKLYYCSAIGFLCDHSTYVHPASSCISSFGAKAIHGVAEILWAKVGVSEPKKIYIGRGAGRNLFNAAEVEKYFIRNGFEIVYPHLLSLQEKINVFGNATHICGPVSSGFANIIFSREQVKVLGFFNFARCFDPFISGLNYAGGFGHQITFLTGYEDVNYNINNSYFIELDRIIECCEEIKFFDVQSTYS